MRKKVLISGAASGIGRACALRFAREGWDVCINDVQVDKLEEVLATLKSGKHLMIAGDCGDVNIMNDGVELIKKEWGVLDVLVNSAGRYSPTSTVNTTLEEWRQVF